MRHALALLFILAACSSETAPPADAPVASDVVDAVAFDTSAPGDVLDVGGAQPCTAGRVEECPCGNGRRGMQTCQPSGVYGPCVCADAGSPMDVVAADAVDVPAARDVSDALTSAQFDVLSCNADQVACGPSPEDCVYLSRGTANAPPRNCGACGITCGYGEGCSEGRCTNPCPRGQLLCEPTAFPVQSGCVDPNVGRVMGGSTFHCGRCGGSCSSTLRCVEGRCR